MRAQDQAANDQPAPPCDPANRWPGQIKFILGNEACERFSYYGMKAILALYITNVLMQTRDEATNIIHLFGFANYFMPLIGAWVSDRLWGRYHTILWISLAYCAGHGVMACSDFIPSLQGKALALYIGLGLIAFGSGGIKPCVSAFMGDQFAADQRHLLQKAYAAFYWSINLGSTASFFVIPFLRKSYGYSWAFGVPGIAMALAVLVFWTGTRRYIRVKPVGDPRWRDKVFGVFFLLASVGLVHWAGRQLHFSTGQTVAAGTCVVGVIIWWGLRRFLRQTEAQSELRPGAFSAVVCYAAARQFRRGRGPSFWSAARTKYTSKSVDDAASVTRILMIFALAPIFWALFDQTFSTWVLQAEKMQPCFISANPQYSGFGIRSAGGIVTKLTTSTNAAVAHVWQQIPTARQQQLQAEETTSRERKRLLLAELNRLITDTNSLYDPAAFSGVKLSLDATELVRRTTAALEAPERAAEVSRLNRLLLDELFPDETMPLYRIGPEEMLAANPILVMLLLPVMTLGLYPALGRLATPLRRMSAGMFLAAFSYVIVAGLQARIDSGANLSILWQLIPYLAITVAEVLFSTTGLEFAFREAAPEMKSTIMGFWNLTVALGNLFVSGITVLAGRIFGSGEGLDVAVTPAMFLFYAGLTFVVGILFSGVAAMYKYRDASAAQGK